METSPSEHPTQEFDKGVAMYIRLRHNAALLHETRKPADRREIFEVCDILLDGLAEIGYVL